MKMQHRVSLVEKEKLGEQAPSLAMERVYTFHSNTMMGRPDFMNREELERSNYLEGDSFAVRCDIAVLGEFSAVEVVGAATVPGVAVPPSDL